MKLLYNFIAKWFAISLLIHLVLAWFSIGFYNFDEHFQILEFAGNKAGFIKSSLLTWEFGAEIRSAFQPYLAYLVIRFLAFFHAYDPFLTATILRLLSAVVGWGSSVLVTVAGLQYIHDPRPRKFFIVTSSVFVPIIFIHAHFSSEGWSGTLAFAGIALVLICMQKENQLKANWNNFLLLISGLFMGMSYICRFQAVIMIIIFMIWLLFMTNLSFKKLAIICSGIFIAVLFGIVLDRMFYGEWVNTAYRYFDANIIKGVAANFGTEPWWWYIIETAKSNFYYLQIPMMILILIGFITNLKNPFVWVSLGFILVHFAISHKELRFLFPLADALPMLLFLGIANIISLLKVRTIAHRSPSIIVLIAFILLNAATLINLCISPSCSFLYPMRYIYSNCKLPADVIITDPYIDRLTARTLKMNFYIQTGCKYRYIEFSKIDSFINVQKKEKLPFILMDWAENFGPKNSPRSLKGLALTEYDQYPDWIRNFNFAGWVERTSFWHVYQTRPYQN